jgi:regulatory protein
MKVARGGAAGERPVSEKSPRERVMTAALRMISTRSYSEGQLRERLMKRESAEEGLVEDCIRRLKEMGYVNDDAFAHNYASSRVRAKPVGRARLARELALKKVAPNRINEALDLVFGEVAEETLIDLAIGRRIRTHGQPSDRAASKRMFDHLARLGFEYDLIIRKLRALRAEIEKNG